MESFMSGAMVVEGALLSFLVALWMTWLALNGLFLLMPLTGKSAAVRIPRPRRAAANATAAVRQHNAA
jgi:hypothetical protein